jgi:hypothetical protein
MYFISLLKDENMTSMRSLMGLLGVPLIMISTPSAAQIEINAFGSTIVYQPPDSTVWHRAEGGVFPSGLGGYAVYKREPIPDSTGLAVVANLAIIYQKVEDSTDLILYSIHMRQQVQFDVTRILGADSHAFSFANAVGYEGTYRDHDVPDIVHRVLVGHMVHGRVGLQVMGDATESVFLKVEGDMRRFLHSIRFRE